VQLKRSDIFGRRFKDVFIAQEGFEFTNVIHVGVDRVVGEVPDSHVLAESDANVGFMLFIVACHVRLLAEKILSTVSACLPISKAQGLTTVTSVLIDNSQRRPTRRRQDFETRKVVSQERSAKKPATMHRIKHLTR
jgi:hypothetical protein